MSKLGWRRQLDLMKGYSAFPKPHHYWNLTIRLFSVLFKILVGGVLTLSSEPDGVFHTLSRLVKGEINIHQLPRLNVFAVSIKFGTHTHTHTHIYIYIYIYRERERDSPVVLNI